MSADEVVNEFIRLIKQLQSLLPQASPFRRMEVSKTMLCDLMNLSSKDINKMIENKNLPEPYTIKGKSCWVLQELCDWMANQCLDELAIIRQHITQFEQFCATIARTYNSARTMDLQPHEFYALYQKGLLSIPTLDIAKRCRELYGIGVADSNSEPRSGGK